jgi:hypothetical protein
VQSVLDDRIIFRPTMVGESAGYEIEAKLAYGRVFLGFLQSERMASPAGTGTWFRSEKHAILQAA